MYIYTYLFICDTLGPYANYTNNIHIYVHTGDAKAKLATTCAPQKGFKIYILHKHM